MNFYKYLSFLFLLFVVFSFKAQSNSNVGDSLSIEKNKNLTISDGVGKSELTSKEKYVLKMLKQSYSMKSIMLQTNVDKKRIKEIKKEYLK